MQGILNDGWNALARYYLNNFCDGTKQASMLQYIYIFWPFNLDTQVMTNDSGLLHSGLNKTIPTFFMFMALTCRMQLISYKDTTLFLSVVI